MSSRHSAFIKAFSLFLLLQVFDLLPVCFCLLMRVLCMCLCVKNSSSQQVSDMTVNISDHVDADKLQKKHFCNFAPETRSGSQAHVI